MSHDVPYLILLKGGPTHNIDDHLSYHAEILSPQFEGEIWTFGTVDADQTFGRFRVRCIKVKAGAGIAAFREFLPQVSKDILSRAETLRKRQVTFTTYEPFVQPFTGYRLARKLGGKLLIEFAGTYKDTANFADVKSEWLRRYKYHQQQVLAQITVNLADGIRLHFPGQVDGFIKLPKSKPISYYYDAIRLDRFEASAIPPQKYVLMVGYPFYRKGVDVLIEAWRELAPSVPDWRLVLVGHELNKHMSAADLATPQIEYVKPMNNEKAADWIKSCGIFVMPSRSDTMPRILMETGAAGRPRIATNVGGMPYMMEDGVSGLYVPPEDPAALRDVLGRLIQDEALRSKIGEAGLTSVHDRFSGARFRADLMQAVQNVHKPNNKQQTGGEDRVEFRDRDRANPGIRNADRSALK